MSRLRSLRGARIVLGDQGTQVLLPGAQILELAVAVEVRRRPAGASAASSV